MVLTFDRSFQRQLAIESWTLYAFGMSFILLRMFARLRRGGYRAFVPDDYLMILAAALYTTLIICLNVIAGGGGSNLFPPDQLSTFSPKEIKERIHGSKIVIVSEQAMLNVVYVLKACMICIYGRLTLQLKHSVFVKGLAVYSSCGYVASQLAFFLACRPFHGYWAVPPPNPQCTTLAHYAITQACFNITSDSLMLAISIPLLLNTTLPLKQKIVLVVIFGMGIFVILAAILTKVYNLRDPYSTVYMLWYVRESSVAIYVVNLPLVWPLMRETFPVLRSFTPGNKSSSGTRSRWRGTTRKGFGTVNDTGGSKNGATEVTVVERGIENIRMDTLRSKKHDIDSVSLDSDEQRLNMGGINQETTVEIEIEIASEHVSRTFVGASVQSGGGWEEETSRYQARIEANPSVPSDDDDEISQLEHDEEAGGRRL